MRLNLTQHGERYLDSTWTGYDRLKHSRDNSASGAWSFLVGEVICLVDSDNERGLHLPVAGALAPVGLPWSLRNPVWPSSPSDGGGLAGAPEAWTRPESGTWLLLSGLGHFVSD